MGLPLRDFVKPIIHIVRKEDLFDKIIGVDTYNYIYAYLMAYTYNSGDILTNEENKTTTHLNVFFYKLIQMIELGIKPVFVFDKNKDVLKRETLDNRKNRAKDAGQKAVNALSSGNVEQYRKNLATSQRIQPYMIDDLKSLIKAFGFPIVDAEFESESQLTYMINKKDIFASASQDYDCLVYGSSIIFRNLFSSRKKEQENGIEMIRFEEFIKRYEITHEQIVDISILAGNDFIDGVNGFGVKTAMKNIKEYGSIDELAKNNDKVKIWLNFEKGRIERVRELFLHPKINETYDLTFKKPDLEEIEYLLVVECNFDPNRVTRGLERLGKQPEKPKKLGYKPMF